MSGGVFRVRVTGRVQCSSTRKQTIRYSDKEKTSVTRVEVEPNTEYSVYVTPGVYTFSVGPGISSHLHSSLFF